MNKTQQSILQRAIAGDRSAFRTLVLENSERVFRLAYRLVGETAAAEDVVQDTFVKVHQKISSFDQRASFSTWLHRVAVNTALDQLRKARTRSKYEADADWSALDSRTADSCPAESQDLERAAASAMAHLSEIERAAFTLRHFEGHSIREIAEILGLGDSASKQAVFRAVRKMRAALTPLVGTTGYTL